MRRLRHGRSLHQHRLWLFRLFARRIDRLQPRILILSVTGPKGLVGAVGEHVDAKGLAHFLAQSLSLSAVVERHLFDRFLALLPRFFRIPQQQLHPLEHAPPPHDVLLLRRVVPDAARRQNEGEKTKTGSVRRRCCRRRPARRSRKLT